MVNAQNLKRPEPQFADIERLVELGLLDPAFSNKPPDTGLILPQGLGFDPMGSAFQSPSPPTGQGGYRPIDVSGMKGQAAGLRANQQATLGGYGEAAGRNIPVPEMVKPKRISNEQVGIGAAGGAGLKMLGASDEAVQKAFGAYVGGISGSYQEDADQENQRKIAEYKAQIDDQKQDIETLKTTFGMTGELADDLERSITNTENQNLDIEKGMRETGEKVSTMILKARMEGTLDPESLRVLEDAYFKATGNMLFDPLSGERDKVYKEAEGNSRRLGGIRIAELTKAGNEALASAVDLEKKQKDLAFDVAANPLRLKSLAAKATSDEIQARIDTATEADIISYFASRADENKAQADMAQMRYDQYGIELDLNEKQKRAQLAYTYKLMANVGKSSGGSGDPISDAAKLEEAFRTTLEKYGYTRGGKGDDDPLTAGEAGGVAEMNAAVRAMGRMLKGKSPEQREALKKQMPSIVDFAVQQGMKDLWGTE